MNFLLRFFLTSVAAYLLFWYLPGGNAASDQPATLLAAVAVALMDSFIRPDRITTRLPITVYTLLIVMAALNALFIKVADRYIPGFEMAGWGRPFLVGFAAAAVSLLANRFVKAD